MPLAQLYIGPGRGDEVKQQRIENVTKAVKDTPGPLKQPVRVIVNEVPLSQSGMTHRRVSGIMSAVENIAIERQRKFQ